ncbi:hva22-like protein a [Nicotiana attenuata]|uniref:HVA22-like protein n=1 Tax=Nicotiana attenuata TaxID=49451 RepID=A0A314KJ98_NICAT|nr:hva22-like protein a [Nicotiana attenuata]
MSLVTLTLQCMDFLAWPIIALGYPLYVSIPTIETGSNYDLRKLVTYWIIFSFIYLFEQVFEKLIKWVPLWPYIRLIAIFWLVIPQFNGAFYFYQNVILPCLQVKLFDVNLYTITEWFNELKKDSFVKKEKFLAVADRSFEENESEPLAKLTASQPECNGDGLVLGGIEVRECAAKGDAAESNEVGTMVKNVVQIEKKASSAIQVYEPAIRASAEVIKLPETSFIQKFQTKWTCAICF